MGDAAPSLILLDLMMPTMDGLTFLQRVRRKPAYNSVPVLVLTSKDLSRTEREQLGEWAQRVFQKGTVKRDELLREITALRSPASKAVPIA
jgi:CheY-like chemotaxis protein